MSKIKERLRILYPEQYQEVYKDVTALIEEWKKRMDKTYPWVSRKDAMLITYGDGLYKEGEAPLKTLREFLNEELKESISAVHLLPMFPYTSDDGFSVTDFRKIHPDLGDWEDITKLQEKYDLMFDAVINHVSKSSEYFQGFLKENEKYQNFFICSDPKKDYSMVTRPRALPLLTPFQTAEGEKYIWTTFSEDQIDFNYKEPAVLLEILDILLFYVWKGARFLRFDAIGFAWKEENTTCMHLPKTHELVKLMGEVIKSCAKGCTIITETNVPHKDNISYFGNGYDEAGLVYQFPLPPLVFHSYISKNAKKLSTWAASLEPTTEATTYFNFLASHDGIGMRPVEDILSKEERSTMVEEVLKRGGEVGYRNMEDGSQVPYELNINYLDAIAGDEKNMEKMVQKFISSQCILLSVMGMPGIYYHSLLGSRNCRKDFLESGIKRRINREKLNVDDIKEELRKDSLRKRVLDCYKQLLNIRCDQEAFEPNQSQKILFLDERLFALIRGEGKHQVLVIINVSDDFVSVSLPFEGVDVISKKTVGKEMTVSPYEYLWLRQKEE